MMKSKFQKLAILMVCACSLFLSMDKARADLGSVDQVVEAEALRAGQIAYGQTLDRLKKEAKSPSSKLQKSAQMGSCLQQGTGDWWCSSNGQTYLMEQTCNVFCK